MYPTTTPNIYDGTDNHVYDVVEIGSYRCVRREAGAPLDQPATLTVSHQHTGSGINTKTRSLVRFDRTVEDGDGNQATQSAYLVVETPTKISNDASIKKTITELTSFLAISGYVDKLLNEEI